MWVTNLQVWVPIPGLGNQLTSICIHPWSGLQPYKYMYPSLVWVTTLQVHAPIPGLGNNHCTCTHPQLAPVTMGSGSYWNCNHPSICLPWNRLVSTITCINHWNILQYSQTFRIILTDKSSEEVDFEHCISLKFSPKCNQRHYTSRFCDWWIFKSFFTDWQLCVVWKVETCDQGAAH